jgi:hypothetical protein
MNLDDVLRDPSKQGALADHDWWVEGLVKDGELTYDPSDNYRDNNQKDELEIEWGYGTIQPNFSDGEKQHVPAGAVERNLPDNALGDASPVIMFARDLMNRGFMGVELQRQLKAKFEQGVLRKAATGLRNLFGMEGIIGCVAVDIRGYADPKQAIAATKKNPNGRFIKFVIAEQRDKEDYLWLPSSRGQQVSASQTSGNAVDDFFSGDGAKQYTPKLVAHCKQTMLPVLAGAGDIDDSELDDTLVEMMNVTGIPGTVFEGIVHNDKYATRLQKVQAAFLWLNRSRTAAKDAKYAQKVDASEFQIERRDQEIEIQAEHRIDPLDIDPVNHALQNQISLEPARQAASPMDVSIFGEMTEVILANQPTVNPLDISLDGMGDFAIDPAQKVAAPLHIQEREIDGMNILDEAIRFSKANTPEVGGLHHSMTVPVDKAPSRRDAFSLEEESNRQMDGLIAFNDDDLNIGELDAPLEISLDPVNAMDAAIDVDVFGSGLEFGLMAEVVAQDVSLAQHEDPMFVGGDIEFNDKPRRSGEMNIEMGNSMEW